MSLSDTLKGKKILFFSVQTFNLEKEIKLALENAGAKVIYYDERPANNNFTKGIIRIKRSIYQKQIDKYYEKILNDISTMKFDYLFINRGEVITTTFLEKFIQLQPNCERIFYTWDSFSNHSYPITLLKYFHKCFTFDNEDAKKYNIGFRPLFFLDEYAEIKNLKNKNYKYDLLFLGTAHSDRYLIGKQFEELCAQNGLNYFSFYYMHSKMVYFYKKLFDSSFKEFDVKKLSFNSLKRQDIINLYKQSKVILDINHPNQKGLTMRIFEAIGAEKKVITTNSEVFKYPFYTPANFFIIDRSNITLDKHFFETEYKEMEENLYNKYSIKGWINEIFSDLQ